MFEEYQLKIKTNVIFSAQRCSRVVTNFPVVLFRLFKHLNDGKAVLSCVDILYGSNVCCTLK